MTEHDFKMPPASGTDTVPQPLDALAQLQQEAAHRMGAFYSAFHIATPTVVNPTGAWQGSSLVK